MPEFLVHFEITLPPGLPELERERIYKKEEKAAAPFFANGTFARCFREAGTRNHWAIWDAPDADYIHRAYETFPLFTLNWGRASIIPLAVNPNDPGVPATECPDVPMTYPVLRKMLDAAKAFGDNTALENGRELCPGVSIHDHPGTDRNRQLHFMVDGQKVAELGPVTDEGEKEIGPGYVDFLAEWLGKPVSHAKWVARIKADNQLLHPDYDTALNAPRARF
jgi:muconolactone delta-isomerase